MNSSNNKKQKLLIAILGACALLLIVWVILIVIVFRGPKKGNGNKDGEKGKSGQEDTDEGVIWLLVLKKHGNQETTYTYDSMGRPIHLEYENNDEWKNYCDIEYCYEDGIPVTKLTITEMYYGHENRNEYTYSSSGTIRTHVDRWDADLGIYANREVYDENERVIDEFSYDEGKLSKEIQTVYDEKGYVITREEHNISRGGWRKLEWGDLDSLGRVTKEYTYISGLDGLSGLANYRVKREIEYAEDGSRVEKNYQTRYVRTGEDIEDGFYQTYLAYEVRIGADDRVLEGWSYDTQPTGECTISDHQIYEYSETGDRLWTTVISERSVWIREFDSKGNLIHSKTTYSDGRIANEQQDFYDEHGNLTKSRVSDDGVEFWEHLYKYTYDAYGNLLSVEYENGTKDIYEYDKIRLSEEQISENAKFYIDSPENMKKLSGKQRAD